MKRIFITILLTISLVLVGCSKNNFKNEILFQGKLFEDYVANQYEVIDNYDKYKEIFANVFDEIENKVSEEDFKDNKYLVVKMYYDYCTRKDVGIINYVIDKGIITINIKYTEACDSCIEMDNYDYYLLKIPKDLNIKDVIFNEKVTTSKKCEDYEG